MQYKPAALGLFRKCLFNQIILFFLATLKLFSPVFFFPLECLFISLKFSCLDHYSFLLPGLTPLYMLLENTASSNFESLHWLNFTLHEFQSSHLEASHYTCYCFSIPIIMSPLKSSASHLCSFVQMTFLIITWTEQNSTCFHLNPHLM